MPSFRLSPERRGVAASTPTRGQMDAGEGTWIPAFAGKTGGGGLYTNSRANGRRGGDVDSGFRRKDGGWRRLHQLAGKRTPGRTWIPAFAGKTGGGGVYGNWRANGHRGLGGDVDSGFRRKDGGDDVQCALRQLAGYTDTWIPAFAGKTGGGGVYANFGQTDGFRRKDEGTWIPAFAGKTEGKLRNGSCLRGGPPTLSGVLSCALI